MGRREDPPIWSGFVDALTTLLLVLMFVLTIFTVVQSVLRDTIDTQGSELDALAAQVEGLADALGLERQRADGLQTEEWFFGLLHLLPARSLRIELDRAFDKVEWMMREICLCRGRIRREQRAQPMIFRGVFHRRLDVHDLRAASQTDQAGHA